MVQSPRGYKFKPRAVHLRLRAAYPAYRWLTSIGSWKMAPWHEQPDKMAKSWGKGGCWAIEVDCNGATIYGPDGDSVYWEDPGEEVDCLAVAGLKRAMEGR